MCMLFFFFKQKTAYEMRISDWSSDVCSSDLGVTIVMGDSRLENEAQRKVRVGFQDLSPKISIATYDRLRRGLLNDVMPSALETPPYEGAQTADFLGGRPA